MRRRRGLIRSRKDGPAPRTIVVASEDPYLGFLVAAGCPDDRVVETIPEADPGDIMASADLVILDLEHPAASEWLAATPRPPTLGVASGGRIGRTAAPLGLRGVVLRPFLTSELHASINAALHRGPLGVTSRLDRYHAMIAPALLVTIVLGALLQSTFGMFDREAAALAAGALAYATVRLASGQAAPRRLAWADVALAVSLLSTAGSSAYTAAALIVSVEAGLVLGPRRAAAAASLLLGAQAWSIATVIGAPSAPLLPIVSALAVFPLGALVGTLLPRTVLGQQATPPDVLDEANRALSSLYDIARTMPAGLDLASVADAALEELCESLGCTAGFLLVDHAGMLSVVSHRGSRDVPTRFILPVRRLDPWLLEGPPRLVGAGDLPPDVSGNLSTHERWLLTPLSQAGVPLGLVLLGLEVDAPEPEAAVVRPLVADAALAIANARLFARLRELAVDEERRRIARDLHDGIAQSLTHIRLELEMLAADEHLPSDLRQEVGRLVRVAAAATDDVRTIVYGLRAAIVSDGLVAGLREYVTDLRSPGGPSLVFSATANPRLDPLVETELFRMAQESLSNAMVHAGASVIAVRVSGDESALHLSVEDNGHGRLDGTSTQLGSGVGLAEMHARAEELGAELSVLATPDVGTVVELVYPLPEHPRRRTSRN